MSGVHQGWNLLSQFCFHKTFPTEFLLSRGKDPDCQAHSCAVVLFYRGFFKYRKRYTQLIHLCSQLMQLDSNNCCLAEVKGELHLTAVM